MDNFRGIILLVCTLFMLSLVLTVCERQAAGHAGQEETRTFQRFVCGFGIGASVNPEWGFMNFDPRIETVDETILSPLEGGRNYSPDGAVTLTDMRGIILPRDKTGGEK